MNQDPRIRHILHPWAGQWVPLLTKRSPKTYFWDLPLLPSLHSPSLKKRLKKLITILHLASVLTVSLFSCHKLARIAITQRTQNVHLKQDEIREEFKKPSRHCSSKNILYAWYVSSHLRRFQGKFGIGPAPSHLLLGYVPQLNQYFLLSFKKWIQNFEILGLTLKCKRILTNTTCWQHVTTRTAEKRNNYNI